MATNYLLGRGERLTVPIPPIISGRDRPRPYTVRRAAERLVPQLELTLDACLAAIADAGLEVSDIDGLSTYPGSMTTPPGFSTVTANDAALPTGSFVEIGITTSPFDATSNTPPSMG